MKSERNRAVNNRSSLKPKAFSLKLGTIFLIGISILLICTWKSNLQQRIEVTLLEGKLSGLFSTNPNKLSSSLTQYTSIMLLGGWNFEISNTISIYNSKEGSWLDCRVTLPCILTGHGTAILNRDLYIFGGDNGSVAHPYGTCYKLGNNFTWIKLSDMNEKRTSISMTSVIFNSEIWIIGGWNGTNPLKTVEKYNPKTDTWSRVPELKHGRTNAAASVIAGKIYVSGGWNGTNVLKTVEVFEPGKETWEMFSDMPFGLEFHASTASGTNLIISGGKKADNRPSQKVFKMDVFDPKKEWIKMSDFHVERYRHCAAELKDGLTLIGGSSKAYRIDSVEIFDGKGWIEGRRLLERRTAFGFIPLISSEEEDFIKTCCA